jgi:hypothetical protein
MRRMRLAQPILLPFLLALSSFSQNFPDAPSAKKAKPTLKTEILSTRKENVWTKQENVWVVPLKDAYFWAGTGFLTSSVLADVHHTQACERNHTCYEANPGADKYKNRIPEIGFIAGANYGCSLMLSEHRRWRAACLILPVTIGIIHWRDATHIYHY